MKLSQFVCLVLFAGLASVSLAQSSNADPLYHHIPADADKLYQINLPGIIAKLDWKAFIANIPAKDKNKSVKDMLADPTVLGIDLTKNILITESNTLKTDSPHYT